MCPAIFAGPRVHRIFTTRGAAILVLKVCREFLLWHELKLRQNEEQTSHLQTALLHHSGCGPRYGALRLTACLRRPGQRDEARLCRRAASRVSLRFRGHCQSNATKGKPEFARRRSDLFFLHLRIHLLQEIKHQFSSTNFPTNLCQRSGHGHRHHRRKLSWLHTHMARIKGLAPHEHRPQDARVLVGQRYRRLLPTRLLAQLVQPL